MNRRSPGRGELLSEISHQRSQRKRSAALLAARDGLSAQAIAKKAMVSLKLAGEALTTYRLATMPRLVGHQTIVDGTVFEDLFKLSERFSLSDARLRVLAKRHRLIKVWAINPQTGKLSGWYLPDQLADKLKSWTVRQSYFVK